MGSRRTHLHVVIRIDHSAFQPREMFLHFVAVCPSGAGEALCCLCRGAAQSLPRSLHLLQDIPASGLGMAERVCVTFPVGAGLGTKVYGSQTFLTHQVANSSGYATWSSTIGGPTRQGAEVSSRARGTFCSSPPPAKGNLVRQLGLWRREPATSFSGGFYFDHRCAWKSQQNRCLLE